MPLNFFQRSEICCSQMRATAMCFSLPQVPICRIHTFASSWWESINKFSTRGRKSSNLPLLSSSVYGHSRRWTRKSLSTSTGGKENILTSKRNISQEISNETSSTSSSLSIDRLEIGDYESTQIQQKIPENRDLSKLITIIVFDIETTGFSKEKDRIIEIALQDLSGGANSTFQTLVNPDKIVTNPHIHGISTHMVSRPGVPRMMDLVPILLQYVRSRRKPGGQPLLIAHNGKAFDVPFLMSEFGRCSYDIPRDWLFMDTMQLARQLTKAEGSTLSMKSLQALREYYNIPVIGQAHRAMADVNVLALVLQRMTCDLKLTLPGLVQDYAFTASQVTNNSKKNKKNGR